MTTSVTQKLVTDLKLLVNDAGDLMKATVARTGDKVAEVPSRILQAASEIKPRLARAEALLEDKAKSAATRADGYVRTSPWTGVGIAAGVALLLGILASRR